MGIDIVSLGVFSSLLCGGAIEVPRLYARTHHDLLRGFAVIQTQTPRTHRDLSGPLRDPVGTWFGRGFLSSSCPAIATTPVSSTPSAKPRPARNSFLSSASPSAQQHPASPCINSRTLLHAQRHATLSLAPNPSARRLHAAVRPNRLHP